MNYRILCGIPLLALCFLFACGHAHDDNHHDDNHHEDNQDDNHNQHDHNQHDHNQGGHEHPDIPEVNTLEVLSRSDSPELLATATEEAWTGELPVLTVDGPLLEVGPRWLDAEGEELEIDYGHFIFQARFAPDSPEVVLIQSRGDYIEFTPEEAGTAEIIFLMMFHGIPVWQTLPIELEVLD